MHATAVIILGLLLLLPVVLVGGLFLWAARKDGEEDKAVQARLGIRRRTRLGVYGHGLRGPPRNGAGGRHEGAVAS